MCMCVCNHHVYLYICVSFYMYVYQNEKERAPCIVGVEVGGFSQPIWDNRVDDQRLRGKNI